MLVVTQTMCRSGRFFSLRKSDMVTTVWHQRRLSTSFALNVSPLAVTIWFGTPHIRLPHSLNELVILEKSVVSNKGIAQGMGGGDYRTIKGVLDSRELLDCKQNIYIIILH